MEGYTYPLNFYYTLSFIKDKFYSYRDIIIDYPLSDTIIKRLNSIINSYQSSSITTSRISVTKIELTDSDIKSCNQNREMYYPEDLYLKQFLWRYAEIKPATNGWLENPVRVIPKFNKEEGRFYHWFHNCKKDVRSSYTLDGEPLHERWDLHNAYFVYTYILCSKILKESRYDNELNRFKELVLSGFLYERVMNHINISYPPATITRDKVKEEMQKYLGFMTETRINARNCDTVQRDIDGFFKMHFPNIRNIILNYSHRYEVNKDKPTVTVCRNGKTFERKNMKRVKNLHRDIAKYEIPLIVTGVCRELESKYGVKPVTVHDAIYMKESDYWKVSDTEIQSILRKKVDELIWN